MIIWGGINQNGLLSDGAIYRLSTDQWESINLTSPPTARYGAAAVWAGDRILIWGGNGSAGELNTGSQLLFDSNGNPTAWRSMSVVNAPIARSQHTAVWNGNSMIVWGGQQNGEYLGDGAVYDPINDSWTALPTAEAPQARSGHSAVWTGQEMLIIGGINASGALASGKAYNPGLSQWRSLSTDGNPQTRYNATAVWTGTEVLIFGGLDSNRNPIGVIQRLNPEPTWYLYRKL